MTGGQQKKTPLPKNSSLREGCRSAWGLCARRYEEVKTRRLGLIEALTAKAGVGNVAFPTALDQVEPVPIALPSPLAGVDRVTEDGADDIDVLPRRESECVRPSRSIFNT